MKNISIGLEKDILREIDESLDELNLKNRSEFFRMAILDKMHKMQLIKLQGSARKLTIEEKKKIKQEFKDKDPTYVLRKFGLD